MSRHSVWSATAGQRKVLYHAFNNAFSVRRDNLPPFGPLLASSDAVTTADIVVVHRLTKSFLASTPERASERRSESISSMLDRNALSEGFSPAESDDVQWGRLRLHHWFRSFKRQFSFAHPTGASARPTGDEQDLVVKLSDINNWEICPELVPDFCNIVYRNHGLKRIVKHMFRKHFPHSMFELFRRKHNMSANVGPCYPPCHRTLLREQIIALLSYSSISRVATVPKDANTDRVISCEPLLTMICQLSLMQDIRTHCVDRLGIDIRHLADVHKDRIRNNITTIDLSAASDYLGKTVVRALWPEHMWKILSRHRPKYFEHDGTITPVHMFAPMGTGITFDVMTLTLWACLAFDKTASVFGDDIIVSNESYPRAKAVLSDIGMVINETKSFSDSPFRESCGGMYHDTIGYLTSFDAKEPDNICDHILLINKLSLIVDARQVSWELAGELLRFRDELASFLPRDVFVGGDYELLDNLVTGLTGANKSTELTNLLSNCLHRPITLARGYERVSVGSKANWDDVLYWNITLFRNFLVPPVRGKTIVRNYTYDRDTRVRLTAFSLSAATVI